MSIKGNAKNELYTLLSLENFKAVLGIDDREDKANEKRKMKNEKKEDL
jgi:hypothetical protein